jgi:uncharacterized membrane protein
MHRSVGAPPARDPGVEPRETDDGDAAAARARRLIRPSVFGKRHAPEYVLALLVIVWSAVFIRLPQLRHDRFGTFGFDLGIYDQGVWLLSRLEQPFVTVRGLDLFGHHANFLLVLLAPAYRLGAGPIFLLVVQVLAQAAGAVALFLLARDLLKSRWIGVLLAAALLLNPTYQWLTWEFFHPDAVAIGPLLFAYWAARMRRWRIFWVATALALLCKEDVALAMALLGLLVAFRGERGRGVIVAALSTVWFFLATRVIIPAQNGIGPFYDAFFGGLGDSPGEVVYNSARHPATTFELATDGARQSWYWKMLSPWALLPLLDLRVMLIAAPMIFVNITTVFVYTRDYRYHYSALIVAVCAVATVEAIAWISARAKCGFEPIRNVLVTLVFCCAFLTSYVWGASPLAKDYSSGIWPLEHDPRVRAKAEAVSRVPGDAPVSAVYNLVPHLTHRERVYEFPVPWCNVNWGVDGENLHDPAIVDWIVVDRTLFDQPGLSRRDEVLLDDLLATEFDVTFSRDDVIVARRSRPPTTASGDPPPVGECYPRPSLERFHPAPPSGDR